MEEKLTEETLHVGGTRPPMCLGVPWGSFVPLVLITAELGYIKWWYMFFMVPIWGAAIVLVRRDYNMPRIVWLWVFDAALDFETAVWGGTSVSPFPLKSEKRFRGISSDAW